VACTLGLEHKGRELAFSQSDTDYQENSAVVISLLTASYRGSYTAFSSAGGGALPGYDVGTEDQYRIRQYALESAYQYRGFSWQQELHTKAISDTLSGRKQTAHGGYAQVGFFPHRQWTAMPRQLEIAVRYARVDPVSSADNARETEITVGVNWFFGGHDNKLSFDYTDGRERLHDGRDARYHIIRLQWDFHI
jgi:phosphate-selective porin OprO/OprP